MDRDPGDAGGRGAENGCARARPVGCVPLARALLLIDLQNDYFGGGAFPLWNTEATLANIEAAVARAKDAGVEVIHIQHVADPAAGISPFFNAGTPGVEIHERIRAAAPDAPVVVKSFADSFEQTTSRRNSRSVESPSCWSAA